MNARFKKNRFLALQPSAQAAMFVVAITGFILPAAVTAQGMDHSRMGHGGMDHSQMNHGTAPAAAPKVDPVHAGHGAAPAPAAPADRSSHTAPPAGASAAAQMDHGPLQGGRPPADARDPNA